jgi:hypothetical protein
MYDTKRRADLRTSNGQARVESPEQKRQREQYEQYETNRRYAKETVLPILRGVAAAGQIGNFIPYPVAQAIGKGSNIAATALDVYGAIDDYSRGNNRDAAMQAGFALGDILLSPSVGALAHIDRNTDQIRRGTNALRAESDVLEKGLAKPITLSDDVVVPTTPAYKPSQETADLIAKARAEYFAKQDAPKARNRAAGENYTDMFANEEGTFSNANWNEQAAKFVSTGEEGGRELYPHAAEILLPNEFNAYAKGRQAAGIPMDQIKEEFTEIARKQHGKKLNKMIQGMYPKKTSQFDFPFPKLNKYGGNIPKYNYGGMIGNIGDEVDLSPEEMEYYRSLGYEFE